MREATGPVTPDGLGRLQNIVYMSAEPPIEPIQNFDKQQKLFELFFNLIHIEFLNLIPLNTNSVMLILGVYILLRVRDQGEGFPSTQLYFSNCFTNLLNLAATCFGDKTIFKWKYIQRKIIRLTSDHLSVELISAVDISAGRWSYDRGI
jgi:hypothetical protein